jgi:membrane protein DedA with SNARE-associated domain
MFEWIVSVIDAIGALGVGLMMFLENVFPPIPSELIMPLAGFQAARGEMSLIAVFLAGTAGSVAGAVLWYWIGMKYGAERLRRLAARHGRWLTLSPADVDNAIGWFDRHGAAAVGFGRLLPGIRTLISVPAGIAACALAGSWATPSPGRWPGTRCCLARDMCWSRNTRAWPIGLIRSRARSSSD